MGTHRALLKIATPSLQAQPMDPISAHGKGALVWGRTRYDHHCGSPSVSYYIGFSRFQTTVDV